MVLQYALLKLRTFVFSFVFLDINPEPCLFQEKMYVNPMFVS